MPRRRPATFLPTTDPTLTDVELLFCREFLVDFNAAKACQRAGMFGKSPNQHGYLVLKRPDIIAEIQRQVNARAARLQITTDDVLRHWWNLATADPRDLVEYCRRSCRYCHGVDHRFQRTRAQMERDRAEFEAQQSKRSKEIFDEQGGDGFNAKREPHPDCPECFGEGIGITVVKDTRHLSPVALRLYAGMRESKDGLEVKMHDPMAALQMVAKHLRMFEETTTLEGFEEKAEKIKRQLAAMDAASAPAL